MTEITQKRECIGHIQKPAIWVSLNYGFPGGSDGKESACNAEDPGSIPESGIFPGGGNGNPLQYSCLKNIGYRLYTGYRLPPYSSWGF